MMRHSIRAASAVLSAFLLFSLAGCSSGSEPSNNIGTQYADKAYGFQLEAPAAGEQVAVMHTSKGDITLRFFPEAAPKAVQNFKEHAEKGYYDGLLFHRVIQDFMIQGGDPKGNGTGGESIFGSKFEDEFDQKLLNLTELRPEYQRQPVFHQPEQRRRLRHPGRLYRKGHAAAV